MIRRFYRWLFNRGPCAHCLNFKRKSHAYGICWHRSRAGRRVEITDSCRHFESDIR